MKRGFYRCGSIYLLELGIDQELKRSNVQLRPCQIIIGPTIKIDDKNKLKMNQIQVPSNLQRSKSLSENLIHFLPFPPLIPSLFLPTRRITHEKDKTSQNNLPNTNQIHIPKLSLFPFFFSSKNPLSPCLALQQCGYPQNHLSLTVLPSLLAHFSTLSGFLLIIQPLPAPQDPRRLPRFIAVSVSSENVLIL